MSLLKRKTSKQFQPGTYTVTLASLEERIVKGEDKLILTLTAEGGYRSVAYIGEDFIDSSFVGFPEDEELEEVLVIGKQYEADFDVSATGEYINFKRLRPLDEIAVATDVDDDLPIQ